MMASGKCGILLRTSTKTALLLGTQPKAGNGGITICEMNKAICWAALGLATANRRRRCRNVQRLIDADELQIKIASLSRLARYDAQKSLLGRVLYIIDQMPTITMPQMRR